MCLRPRITSFPNEAMNLCEGRCSSFVFDAEHALVQHRCARSVRGGGCLSARELERRESAFSTVIKPTKLLGDEEVTSGSSTGKARRVRPCAALCDRGGRRAPGRQEPHVGSLLNATATAEWATQRRDFDPKASLHICERANDSQEVSCPQTGQLSRREGGGAGRAQRATGREWARPVRRRGRRMVLVRGG